MTAPAVFVVSTGRTGTQFLATTFAEVARSFHEPGPWWVRHVSNAHASGSMSTARATRIVHRLRDAALSEPAPYLEASCLVYGLVRPLLDAYPEATVVQVVRHPRTYVQSGLDWGAYRFGGRVLNVAPFRRLAPPQFDRWDLRARLAWVGEDQFARLCWAWAAMNRAMRTQGEGDPRFRTVRFEDLTDAGRGPGLLSALAADLGLEVAPDRWADRVGQRVNASTPTKARAPWTDDRERLLAEHTAEEAAHYGY